jgi:hypothetical protein
MKNNKNQFAVRYSGLGNEIKKLLESGKTRQELYDMWELFNNRYGIEKKNFKAKVREKDNALKKRNVTNSMQLETSADNLDDSIVNDLDNIIEEKKAQIKYYSKEAWYKRFLKEKQAVEKAKNDTQEIFDNLVDAVKSAGLSKKIYKPMVYSGDHEGRVGVLQISDIHLQEIVQFFGDLKDLNYYDVDIARKRLQYVFDRFLQTMLDNGIKNAIIVLQGDIVSGLIHDELKYSMNGSVFNAMISFAKCVSYNLEKMAKKIGIKIVCVSGNHGRLTKRIEYKHKASNNLDYMFYKLLEAFSPDLNFHIPDETFHREEINGKNFIIHHGDFAKGGKNITGAPAFTTSRDVSFIINNIYNELGFHDFEAALLGHFHTSFDIPGLSARVIGNGALIGTNDFAVQNALASPACQNCIIVNSRGRVETVMKIFCDHIKE